MRLPKPFALPRPERPSSPRLEGAPRGARSAAIPTAPAREALYLSHAAEGGPAGREGERVLAAATIDGRCGRQDTGPTNQPSRAASRSGAAGHCHARCCRCRCCACALAFFLGRRSQLGADRTPWGGEDCAAHRTGATCRGTARRVAGTATAVSQCLPRAAWHRDAGLSSAQKESCVLTWSGRASTIRGWLGTRWKAEVGAQRRWQPDERFVRWVCNGVQV